MCRDLGAESLLVSLPQISTAGFGSSRGMSGSFATLCSFEGYVTV